MTKKKAVLRSTHHVLYSLENVQYPEFKTNIILVCDVDQGMDSAYIPCANGYIEAIYPSAAFDVRVLKWGPALEVQAWADINNISVSVMLPPGDSALTIALPY